MTKEMPAASAGPAAAGDAPADTRADTAPDAPPWAARKLLRAARAGTLASSMQGQPFASLVTPATAPDLAVVLLLSDLSEHTRHLRADPRCSVLVCGTAEGANPQTAPRVTGDRAGRSGGGCGTDGALSGTAPLCRALCRVRRFRVVAHPAAERIVRRRLRPGRAATRRRPAPDPAAVAAIAAAEADIIAHCNADHPDAMSAVAGSSGEWRMVAVDVDGCDLAQDERVVRVAWSAPVSAMRATCGGS